MKSADGSPSTVLWITSLLTHQVLVCIIMSVIGNGFCIFLTTRNKSKSSKVYAKLLLNKRSIVVLLFSSGLRFIRSPLLFQSVKHFLHAPALIYCIMCLFCPLNLKLNNVTFCLGLIECCTGLFSVILLTS